MLGGAINDPVSQARQETVFDEGGERLTEAVVLAKRYPQARVVYTSGSSSFYRGDLHGGAASAKTHVADGDRAGAGDDRGQIPQHR